MPTFLGVTTSNTSVKMPKTIIIIDSTKAMIVKLVIEELNKIINEDQLGQYMIEDEAKKDPIFKGQSAGTDWAIRKERD